MKAFFFDVKNRKRVCLLGVIISGASAYMRRVTSGTVPLDGRTAPHIAAMDTFR